MNDDLDGLPADVRAEIERPSLEKHSELNALGRIIADMRDAAVKYRKESGIEHTWMAAEEQYLGMDDVNRHEFGNARWAKPLTMAGGLTRESVTDDDSKATIFVNETRRYVNAGSAKVCEINLPMDGKPFTLKATPVPELSEAEEDETPAEQVTGQPMPGVDGQQLTVKDLAKHAKDRAEKAAEKAADRIHDWLVECKHPAEMRKVIFDGARIGVGVLKGPIPEVRTATAVRKMTDANGQQAVALEMVKQTKPSTRWTDPWRFYPAPGCGEDIHKGDHCFEVDPMLAGELRALAEQGFNAEAITKVIEEGPGKVYMDAGPRAEKSDDRKQFEVWHMTGSISRRAFEAANEEQSEDLDDDEDRVYALVSIVNDTVIRAVLHPLQSGQLPYHVFCWSRRAGHWAGVGVAEQVAAPQRLLNSAVRAMVNNAAASAGAHVVMDDGAVEPAAKGDYRMGVGDKLWLLNKASGVDDVRKVFATYTWPNTTPQLMVVIEFAMQQFEEHSSIPLVTQGQSGDTTPDTFSGQQLQDNNANQLLRDVGFGLNDTVTTPLIDQMYEVLLMDPNVPNDEKGDYQVDTSGALAIIEKALQDQFLPLLLQASANPAYELSPARVMEGLIRSKRMVPSHFTLTEEEKEQRAQQPPPKAPAVEAAEIRAQASIEIAKSADALAAEKVRVDTDRDRVYNELMAAREQSTREGTMAQLALQERIANLNYNTKLIEFATRKEISLEAAKVKLATETMGIRAQMELAGRDGEGPEVSEPPTEPPGRAPDGQAYQR